MASLLFRRFLDNSFCAPPAKQNLSVEEDGGWPSCRHRQLLWEARSSQLLCEKQLAFLWEAASSCDWRTTDRWASRTHQLPVRAASDTGFHQALNIRFQQRFKQKISHKIQTQDFARALNISPVFEDNISLEFKDNISQEFWKYYCARALNMSMISYDSININMIFICQNFVPTRGYDATLSSCGVTARIVITSRVYSHAIIHCYTSLYLVIFCCTLLYIVAYCCTLL